MAKLDHLPGREELRRLRERWDLEDREEVPLKDYDTTLTSGIDDTLNQLVSFRNKHPGFDRESDKRDQAITQLRDEVKKLRKEMEAQATSIKHKAGKAATREMERALTENFIKKLDTLKWLVGVGVTLLGALIAYKGR